MPGSIACTECRRSHLKCDLQRPICSRCATNRLSCTYLPSRRGGRRVPRDITSAATGLHSATSPSSARATVAEAACDTSPLEVYDSGANNEVSPVENVNNLEGVNPPGESTSHTSSSRSSSHPYVPEARLVHLYYMFFHQAHPILVPASFYNDQAYPDYLHQVIRFIGSHYSKVLCADDFLEQTIQLLNRDVRSPAMVQSLLLFSIIMSARNSRDDALSAKSRAVSIALGLGMHRADFARSFSNCHDVQIESLRRTWWELFIWEVYLAIPDSKINLRCSAVESDVCLPCEEATYASSALLQMRPAQTFHSFRTRLFGEQSDSDNDSGTGEQQAQSPCTFSSYSFRIEAFYILARVLVLNTQHETHPDHLQSIANMIVSWGHLLPNSKVDVVDMYGNIDEMLFQAQFIVQYASAMLHVPRSNLRPKFPSFPSTICPETPVRLSPSLTRHAHNVKAIGAAKELSTLLSVHSNPQGYSPSMIPGTVLSGLVQLAAASEHTPKCFEHHQNRAVLVLSTLRILKMQWLTAHEAFQHIKAVAATSMSIAAPLTPAPSSSEPSSLAGSKETCVHGGSNTDYCAGTLDEAIGSSNMDSMFMPGLLSPYIDQTCSESLEPNLFLNFDRYSNV